MVKLRSLVDLGPCVLGLSFGVWHSESSAMILLRSCTSRYRKKPCSKSSLASPCRRYRAWHSDVAWRAPNDTGPHHKYQDRLSEPRYCNSGLRLRVLGLELGLDDPDCRRFLRLLPERAKKELKSSDRRTGHHRITQWVPQAPA